MTIKLTQLPAGQGMLLTPPEGFEALSLPERNVTEGLEILGLIIPWHLDGPLLVDVSEQDYRLLTIKVQEGEL